DLPVTLTQGDRVSIPVAAYNYAGAHGDVSLQLQPEDWYSLVEDTGDKTIRVDAGRVGGAQFTIEAKRIGKFKLTLSARMAGGTSPFCRAEGGGPQGEPISWPGKSKPCPTGVSRTWSSTGASIPPRSIVSIFRPPRSPKPARCSSASIQGRSAR